MTACVDVGGVGGWGLTAPDHLTGSNSLERKETQRVLDNDAEQKTNSTGQ